jgi:hypothetical protein
LEEEDVVAVEEEAAEEEAEVEEEEPLKEAPRREEEKTEKELGFQSPNWDVSSRRSSSRS